MVIVGIIILSTPTRTTILLRGTGSVIRGVLHHFLNVQVLYRTNIPVIPAVISVISSVFPVFCISVSYGVVEPDTKNNNAYP
jgi:uncharacterized protein YacL